MNKARTMNIQHMLIHALSCLISVVVYAFASNFLLYKGYSSSQIGVIMSISSLSSILLQPIVANFVDRSKKFSVIEVMLLMFGLSTLLFVPLYLIKSDGLVLTIVFITIYCLYDAAQPLFNIIGVKIEEFGVISDYGFARAFGSISFALFNALMGNLIHIYDENIIAISGIVSYIMLFGLLVWMKQTFKQSKKVAEVTTQIENVSLKEFVVNNKKLLILFITIALFLFTDNIINFYLIQVITPLNGTTVDQGYLGLMWALLEVPTMMSFSRINKKFSLETLLIVSSIMFLVRAIGLYLANNMFWVYISLSLQWCSFALFQPAIVEYINANTKANEKARGQALKTTICCIGTMITNLIGGFFIDIYSVKTLLLVGTIITAIGTILFTFVIKDINKNKQSNKSTDYRQ